MSTSLKNLITSDKIKGIIAIAAAIIMYFTPDHIDAIIETCLVAFGISTLIVKEKE